MEAIKNILFHPLNIDKNIEKLKIQHFLLIFLIYVFLSSFLLTIMPPDMGMELSKNTLQINEKSFFFYFSKFITFNSIHLIFLCLLFIVFTNFLKTKIKILIALFSNIVFFYIHYLFLKKFLFFNWTFLAILLLLLVSTIKKYKEKFAFLIKINIFLSILEILFFPVFLLFIIIKNQNLYVYTEMIVSLWILVIFANILKRKFEISIISSFFSIILSYLNSIFIFFILKSIGMLGEKSFKTLLFFLQ